MVGQLAVGVTTTQLSAFQRKNKCTRREGLNPKRLDTFVIYMTSVGKQEIGKFSILE